MDSLPLIYQDTVKTKFNISVVVKAGLVLTLTALVDMTVAFSTAYWATWSRGDQYGGYGLWKVWQCISAGKSDMKKLAPLYGRTGDICQENMADFSFPGWYVTTQVFTTLTMAGMLACTIMLILYAIFPQSTKSKYLMSTVCGVGYLSGLLLMVSLCVFGFKVSEEMLDRSINDWFLSWSFSLACTAFVLNQVAASILVTETKKLFETPEPVLDNTKNDIHLSLPQIRIM